MGVTITIDRMPNLIKSVKELTSQEVKIGVTGEKAERKPEPGESNPPNNAEIGYMMEFGAPEKNIPARPFLIPGVQSIKADAIKALQKAAQAALDEDMKGCRASLMAIGLKGQVAVQEKIDTGPFAPLSPKTIAARVRRLVKGRSRKRAAGMKAIIAEFPETMNKPLVDTGALRAAITFIVDNKGKKTK